MKKYLRLLSVVLVVALCLSFGPTTSATNVSRLFDDDSIYSIQQSGNLITVTMSDKNNVLLQKTEYNQSSGDIVTIIYHQKTRTAEESLVTVERRNIEEFIVNSLPNQDFGAINEIMAASAPAYTFYKRMSTPDHIYLGAPLAGDTYYRDLGITRIYNRLNYNFVRGTAITAILAILTSYVGVIRAAASAAAQTAAVNDLLFGFGIGVAGGAITIEWKPTIEAVTYDYQFKCSMVYNGKTYTMSEIHRDIEYSRIKDDKNNYSYFINMDSYLTESAAKDAFCTTAFGYAARAFEVKFISGYDPGLSLPVDTLVW